MVQAKTWKDTTPGLSQSLQNNLDGVAIFQTVATVLYQYVVCSSAAHQVDDIASRLLSRFKDMIRNHPDIVQVVMDLAAWFDTWAADVSASPPRFEDSLALSPVNISNLALSRLKDEIDRLKTIVQRESQTAERLKRPTQRVALSPEQRREALYSQLAQTYNPPGSLRPEGSRHDNDKENVADIRIAPTHSELLSPIAPYLPVFLPEAPHHLQAGSMERHLDIQFRLLREELMYVPVNCLVSSRLTSGIKSYNTFISHSPTS